jgi:hypothetical protein
VAEFFDTSAFDILESSIHDTKSCHISVESISPLQFQNLKISHNAVPSLLTMNNKPFTNDTSNMNSCKNIQPLESKHYETSIQDPYSQLSFLQPNYNPLRDPNLLASKLSLYNALSFRLCIFIKQDRIAIKTLGNSTITCSTRTSNTIINVFTRQD